MDSQVIERLGRNRLVDELLRAGLEVAEPIRDRGVDLVAYSDKGTFAARPIQLKAASGSVFSLDRKYEAFPGLLLVYLWYLSDPQRSETYVLDYAAALRVADAMGYTATASWSRGSYACNRPGARLVGLLAPHRATPETWRALVGGS